MAQHINIDDSYEFLTKAGRTEAQRTIGLHESHITHANQVLRARISGLLGSEDKLDAVEVNLHLREMLELAKMNLEQLTIENESLEAEIQDFAKKTLQRQERINLNRTVVAAIASS